jgi:tRNA wybutosine-synthesizing protein 3
LRSEGGLEVKCWCRLKSRILARLSFEASKGLVDSDIVAILEALNRHPYLVTVSSCSGRIALISAPKPGDKKLGGIVAKWHRPISVEEVKRALVYASHRYTWLSVQPVVLALYAYGEDVAETTVEALVRAGMKYTGARRLSSCPRTYYILSMGVERLDIPLVYEGRRLFDDEKLPVLVKMANELLSLAKTKLAALKRVAASISFWKPGSDEATLCGAGRAVIVADLAERTSAC